MISAPLNEPDQENNASEYPYTALWLPSIFRALIIGNEFKLQKCKYNRVRSYPQFRPPFRNTPLHVIRP
jgi:hypothetical protein